MVFFAYVVLCKSPLLSQKMIIKRGLCARRVLSWLLSLSLPSPKLFSFHVSLCALFVYLLYRPVVYCAFFCVSVSCGVFREGYELILFFCSIFFLSFLSIQSWLSSKHIYQKIRTFLSLHYLSFLLSRCSRYLYNFLHLSSSSSFPLAPARSKMADSRPPSPKQFLTRAEPERGMIMRVKLIN